MTTDCIMEGNYTHLEFKPGLKVARVWIEIPTEHAGDFIAKFGTPDPANPVRVAIARLNTEIALNKGDDGPTTSSANEVAIKAVTPSAQGGKGSDSRRFKRSEIAALKCKNSTFAYWILPPSVPFGDNAELLVLAEQHFKEMLGIKSKRELDSDPAKGEAFDRLLASFDYRDSLAVKRFGA